MSGYYSFPSFGALATATDPGGNFVIDMSNNPSGLSNGYGWTAAPGSSAYISPNYFGNTPLPNYQPGPR